MGCEGEFVDASSSLSKAELYLTIASLDHRFDFDLYKTTVADVNLVRDNFAGAPQDGSLRVRVIVGAINYSNH